MTTTSVPSKARQWFAWREPANWAITIGLFVPVYFVAMLILGGFFAAIICVAAAFCLFFFLLEKRAIGIECPNCGKYILTNTPWICGVCGTKNLRVDDFPFIGRCQNPECGTEPKAYECHHCRDLIFFTPDRQRTGFARCANVPANTKSRIKRDKHEETLLAKRKSIQRKSLEFEEAKIDVELKGLRQSLEGPKMKSIEEKYRASVKNEDDARRLHAAIDRECTDPVEREKRHRMVDDITRETL